MNKTQFAKHLDKIQTFMGLDNWIIESNSSLANIQNVFNLKK